MKIYAFVILLVYCVHGCCSSETLEQQAGVDSIERKLTDGIKKVNIVFMNHLDVGYADLVNNILNRYFQHYFPQATAVWRGLKDGGYVETFIYTTHPWLVSLYLDCPPNLVLSGVKLQCPSASQKADFISAVKEGYITWHAGPMNLEIEMTQDSWLFDFAIELSKSLDKRFGIQRNTLVLSQRDVPGMTQAVIPSLVRHGVSGVTVGVNDMTPPPALSQLFVWQFGTDSVLGTWHPGGYPDNPGPNPANPGGISKRDCVVVDGLSEALCFAFRTDNSGPPESVQEVLSYYEILRAEFPNAELKASRLEEFFEAAEAIRDKLPVFTNEVGDTWIEGVASDPRKCAEYRAVSRVMKACFNAGQCSLSDTRVWNSSVFLVKLPEHTWGLYSEGDTINWANDKFHQIQFSAPQFIRIASSWVEQREFIYKSIEALQDHSVVSAINRELDQLTAKLPALADFEQVDPSQHFKCRSNNINLGFGSDGSIVHLDYHGKSFASAAYPMSQFVYVSYNETDFNEFGKVYNYNGNSAGYYKNNLTKNFKAVSQRWDAQLISLYKSQVGECEFYAEVKMADVSPTTLYGAPQTVWLHYTVNSNAVDIDVQMFNKTSTRVPEAIFVAFQLKPPPSFHAKFNQRSGPKSHWKMSKLGGQMIDPYNVILNGSQYQHVLDDGGVSHVETGVKFSSLDVPIATPITSVRPSNAFPAPLSPVVDDITGFAFNIYNNIWETNYIMWYPYLPADAHFKARFRVDFSSVPSHQRKWNFNQYDKL